MHDALADIAAWPEWWRGVTRAEPIGPESTGGVGSRYRFVFRSRLPYSLRFEMTVVEHEPSRSIVGRATGELEGTGRWTLSPQGNSTLVRYDWDVRTTRWWMNLIGPLARPIFEANHDQIMEWGQTGLGRRLHAAVTVAQPPSGSGSSRGAPTGD